MRILHLVHQYPPEFVGGTELYTQALAAAQVQMGHQVALFHPSTAPEGSAPAGVPPTPIQPRTGEDGVRVYGVPLGARGRTAVFAATFHQPALSRALAAVLAAERPDLVHVQHLMGLPAGLVTQIRAAGIPYVVTLHDYWYPCANAQLVTNYDGTVCAGPRAWVNCGRCALARAGHDWPWLAPGLAPLLAYRAARLRRVLAGAAAIIAPTQFVRQTYGALGLPVARLVVVGHGLVLPAGYVPPKREAARPGMLHVVYLGSVAWQKGVHVLVAAVNQLPHEGVRLTIYGRLDDFPDYVADLRARATHPGIRFAGRIDRAALWAALAQADVLAVPSLWYETAALVIQEGFAAGLPVVAADLGALTERVRDGVDGLLLPAGDAAAWRDALRRLRDTPGLLDQLRTNIQPVRTIAEHVSEIERVYRAGVKG